MKLLLILLTVTLISCSGGRNSTGYSLINDMMYSETYESFSENPVFDNGQTMQAPPMGTVARGKMPHPKTVDGENEILENPLTMDEYAWQRGEILYGRMCSACHGKNGQANGLVVTKGGYPEPPKFKSRRFKYSKKDRYTSGNIYNVIKFGLGNMPSYGVQLYEEDIWHVAEYVRERLMVKGKK